MSERQLKLFDLLVWFGFGSMMTLAAMVLGDSINIMSLLS